MPNLHQVEEVDKKLPLLCIYGGDAFLQEKLVAVLVKKFRVIVVAEKKPDFLESPSEIYFLTFQDVALLPKLEETIDYAIIFQSGEKGVTALPSLMAKLANDNAHVLFILSVFTIIKTLDLIREYKSFLNIRFALLGELMTRKQVDQKGELSKIIEQTISSHTIDLNGSNLSSIYPISAEDVHVGISRLLLGNFKSSTIHYLFYKRPETILQAAHAIARIDPDVKINFTDEKSNSLTISREEIRSIVESRLQMHDSYMDSSFGGFDKSYKNILEEKIAPEDKLATKTLSRNARRRRGKKKFASISKFIFLSAFFGSFLFIFLNLLFFGIGLLYLRLAVENIKSENFKNVEKDSRTSNYFLSIIKPTTDLTFETIGSIDLIRKVQNTYLLLLKAGELSELTGTTVTALLKTSPLSEKILTTLTSNLSFLYQEGQRIKIETGNKTISARLKETYSKLLSLSEILPIVLGFHGEKNYLLLFQNDEELRPTGGFIGSIGDLAIKEGRVDKLTIQDVYELDGQLRNHIEPPFIVRRYLQPHLYLRDSNFYQNFQESASKSAFLYNLETGKKPDAVIAIDLDVLKQILKVSGPISLPDYNITVTSDTVSQFIQSTIKNNFFPGSTQKRDILNKLFTQLILKTSSDQKFYIEIVKLLPDLLEQKDILVSFSDNSIQKIFSANNYGGEYTYVPSTDPKKINDFLYINEANIGANKANANISRTVSYEAMIEQGKLASKAILELINSGDTDGYKVYIKLAVPKGSVLKQIIINDVKQTITPAVTDFRIYEAKNFKAPVGLETEQFDRDNLTYFAFVATVERDNKASIQIIYDNGAFKPLTTVAKYSLQYVKQPGTKPYQLTTTIDYPEGYVSVNSTADSYGKNFLEKSDLIKKDLKTQIEIQKASVQK